MEQKENLLNLGATGGQFLVSRGLQNRVTRLADGSIQLNLDASTDEEESEDEGEPKSTLRGKCANQACTNEYETSDLKRCMRCFEVDYCCRECQKQDWPRHKKAECKGKDKKKKSNSSSSTNNNPSSSVRNISWQALILKGKEAMIQQGNFPLAISYFEQAIKKCDGLTLFGSLYVDYAGALFRNGDLQKAVKMVYRAIEIDPNNVDAYILKTKMHLDNVQDCSDDKDVLEVAFYHANSTAESFAYKMAMTDPDYPAKRALQEKVEPLRMELLQEYMYEVLVPQMRAARDRNLTRQLKLVNKTVPFTFEVSPSTNQAGLIQSKIGEGWRSIGRWSKPIAYHSAVSYNGSIVLFGGVTDDDTCTNEVFVFCKNDKHPKLQDCTGTVPPPVQGHAACVVGKEMFVFGGMTHDGEQHLNDLYALDLETWKWSKPSSLSTTTDSHRPEHQVCFCTLTPLNDRSILLLGGRRDMKVQKANAYAAFTIKDEDMDKITSDNLHVYSLETKMWKKVECQGEETPAPRVWGHSALDIGKRRILVFGGSHNQHAVNAIYILDTQKMTWALIEPSLLGIPPGLESYRDAVWVPHREQLFVFGGRYHQSKLLHDVGKHSDSIHDTAQSVQYSGEMCCFDLEGKIWHRVRVPKHPVSSSDGTSVLHCGHKMVYLGGGGGGGGKKKKKKATKKGALFLFGGSFLKDEGERVYNKDIFMFDFDTIGRQVNG